MNEYLFLYKETANTFIKNQNYVQISTIYPNEIIYENSKLEQMRIFVTFRVLSLPTNHSTFPHAYQFIRDTRHIFLPLLVRWRHHNHYPQTGARSLSVVNNGHWRCIPAQNRNPSLGSPDKFTSMWYLSRASE